MKSKVIAFLVGGFGFMVGAFLGFLIGLLIGISIFPDAGTGSFLISLFVALLFGGLFSMLAYRHAVKRLAIHEIAKQQQEISKPTAKEGWQALSTQTKILIFVIPASLGLVGGIISGITQKNFSAGLTSGIFGVVISIPISIGLLIIIGALNDYRRQGNLGTAITIYLIFGFGGALFSLVVCQSSIDG